MIIKQPMAEERRKGLPPFSLFFQNKNFYKGIGLLFIFLLFLLPVLRLVWLSFVDDGSLTLHYYTEILRERATWSTVQNTLVIVFGSTVLALVLGVAFAWIVAYVQIRGKRAMQLFIFLPFIIPSYITTLAWTQFFGGSGPVTALLALLPGNLQAPSLYSIEGIILLLGLSHYPLVYLFTVNVFRKIPRDLEEAAATSGLSRKQAFRKVVLPLALPGIASGGLIAFLSNLDNFGIPAFLGTPANIRVLSTYIYEQVVGFGPKAFSRAAVLSVMLGAIALLGTLMQWFLLRRSRVTETVRGDMAPRIFLKPVRQIVVEGVLWSFLLVTSLMPLVVMGALSLISAYGVPFKRENLSLKNYEYVFLTDVKPLSALTNSLQLALVTMAICLVLGTILAYLRFKFPDWSTKTAELFITIPYALPGTVFALCMIFMWMEPVPGWNPGVYGTALILFIAYATRFMVLQIRGSYTAFLQLDPSMDEAARTSGAKGWVRWRKVLLPLLFPGILSGALLVFLMALTELTVSSLLWSSGTETVGVVIFGYEQAGYSTYSTAFSTVLVLGILLGGLLFMGIGKLWDRKVLKAK
ncbi:iron(III) transport system permease protein [Planomicrobium soli]|uniref:Iron(III) transport system permease protein n=1 Tax=Planomicrobium soli TaxID=1176648 RepID=A0A2P8H5Q1_9BACL|nr:iron ABC transporter permease [Planomicrobium soli]PSL41514.1 iron(III) transport system permease protein [Planomicrobium soli]